MGCIYAMSDIHGCYDQYLRLLREIGFKDEDTLYVLGDVIDRGPDGVKVLRDMMGRPNVYGLIGNHEYMAAACMPFLLQEVTRTSIDELNGEVLEALQDWINNGGGATLREFREMGAGERREILEFIGEFDAYAEVEAGGRRFVLVHAGLENFYPERPLDSYRLDELIYGRPNLTEDCFPDRYLIAGHTPTRLLRAREAGQKWTPERSGEFPDTIYRKGKLFDIDCGCCFGGQLGCLCLDTLEEHYV